MSGGGRVKTAATAAAAASAGAQNIPTAARKVVQSLKEIVNCPEAEIYAMLKECNMDPNETVSRLLSQDTFHEVKSKREKKKENKESSDIKSRGSNSTSSRGGKFMADRSFGRSGSSQLISSSDAGLLRANSSIKKENGGAFPSSSINTAPSSYSIHAEGNRQSAKESSVPTPSQPIEYQSTWAGLPPGQLSMADIVKRGRPQSKPPTLPFPSTTEQHAEYPPIFASLPSKARPNLTGSQALVSEVGGISNEVGAFDSEGNVGSPSILLQETIRSTSPDEIQVLDHNKAVTNYNSVPNLESHSEADIIDNVSHFEDNSYDDRPEYLQRSFEHQEGSDYPETSQGEDVNISVSSAAVDFQQLSLQREEVGLPEPAFNAEDNLAVVMPDHLQVSSADSAHLNFGSFGSGMSAASFSGPFVEKNLENNLLVVAAGAAPVEHPNERKNEYYGHDQPSLSQPEVQVVNHGSASQSIHGHSYAFPTALASYAFENAAQANAAGVSFLQTNSQMHNLAHLSTMLSQQPYPSSLPSGLLASTVQPVREMDPAYSPFAAVAQSLPMKHSTSMPPVTGSALSVPEGIKSSVFPTHQLPGQTLPSSNLTQGLIPQHLPVHPYSPSSLSLAHFSNMIGYPFLPQSYPYLPPYGAGSGAFHQSPAAVSGADGLKYTVPQYKTSTPGNSLPQAGAIAPGYGGNFGNAASLSNLNNLNASNSRATTLDALLSSQLKEGSQYVSLHQNEGSNSWIHGPNSRTMSTFPPSTCYGFQNQNQPSGFQQGQQPPPYGALGYPNIYHSQPGVVSQEHRPPTDGALATSQGPTSQQSQQIWQQSY